MKCNSRSTQKGFTLIEVIMVIVILGIMLPGIMLYFIQGVRDSSYSQKRTTAIFLADALMEEIRSTRWDEVAAGINTTCSNASAIGSDVGESRINYDDIDDFNNLNNTPPSDSQGVAMANYAGFQQQVTVSYVNPAALDTAVGGPTCYKRVEVRIIDTGINETTKLVSLMTGY